MQSEYIKECNKMLFDVPFFNSLNNKALLSLAEAVTRRITHPDEIIKRRGEISDFTILQKGVIGLVCKKGKSSINGKVIETYSIESDGKKSNIDNKQYHSNHKANNAGIISKSSEKR